MSNRGPELIAIAAMAENRVIGLNGKLPWHCPEDLRFFKKTTLGHPIVFGATTFRGIGRALPGRLNIVLSKTMPETESVRVMRSEEELAKLDESPVFICGGATIYSQLLSKCSKVYLTRIKGAPQGDAWMPPFEQWFQKHEVLENAEAYCIELWLRNVQD